MKIIAATAAMGVLLTACSGAADSPGRPPSTVRFGDADAILYVEVADTAEERREGLMGVENLPVDQGMAFVFEEEVRSTFWMKDTLIPLSIAFVDDAGRVIGVRDMQPCAAEPCPSYGVDGPYVLAVEANLGWFEDHDVGTGDRAELTVSAYG